MALDEKRISEIVGVLKVLPDDVKISLNIEFPDRLRMKPKHSN